MIRPLVLEPNDVAAADTRIIDQMREADDFACLSNTAGTVGLETELMEGFFDGRLNVENVITPGKLTIYREDAKRAARWQEYVKAGATVYCYDGRIPCNMVLVDEAVFLGDRCLDVVGLIESTNDTVRSWAVDLLETYRDEAEKLDPTAFSPELLTVEKTASDDYSLCIQHADLNRSVMCDVENLSKSSATLNESHHSFMAGG